MDFRNQLSLSYYQNIATLNEAHQVYLVKHRETGKIYVKKILTRYNLSIYRAIQSHPITGVPKVIELYEEDHILTVIEEYISGDTLQDRIQTGILTESEICHYISELCALLDQLHSLQPPIIHRDIKPSNVVITAYNHVVLLDFNIARYYTEGKSADTVLLGTQGYAAPEQYGFGSSSQQTDIYAIGILLKELNASLSTPSRKFDPIIQKCTQLEPAHRFHSVSELERKIQDLSAVKGSTAPSSPRNNHNRNYPFLPPGYRSLNFWHMLLATPAYFMVLGLSLTYTPNTGNGSPFLWLERIFILLIFLSIIAISCDYMGFLRFIPFYRHSNRLVRFLTITLLDVAVFFLLTFLMVIIESVVGSFI